MLVESLLAAASVLHRPIMPHVQRHPSCRASAGEMVPREDFERLQADLKQTHQELAAAKARLSELGGVEHRSSDELWGPDRLDNAFDEVDANGDGVLTLEEFRRGYALLTGDAVAMAFDQLDVDGNGTLDRDEFRSGFALLTSDSARAEAERKKVEAAVSEARISAVKEAAKNLAEAQLMDRLYGEPAPGESRWPETYRPIPGRQGLPRKRPQKSWKDTKGAQKPKTAGSGNRM